MLNLAHNQLEIKGLTVILEGLAQPIQELSVADNLLGPKAGTFYWTLFKS